MISKSPRLGAVSSGSCLAFAMGLLLLLLLAASSARAAAAPSHPFRFEISEFEPEEHRHEFLEGPCGLALDSQGDIYVGDYYHDQVLAFGPSGSYVNRMRNEEPADGPCGLAVDSSGRLYVNNLHRNVLGFTLSLFPPASFPRNNLTEGAGAAIDSEHSTGLALDPATGDLYVDDRTYVAFYEAPVEPGELPDAKIGLGSLGDGYGVAVSGFEGNTEFASTEGYVYAPDAASDTVKVFDPALEPAQQLVGEIDAAGTPQAGFASLLDSALAVDDSDGHVFVVDNLQSLDYEHPRAALDEFNPAGEYRGQLPQFPILFAGEPNGLAIDNSGGASQGDVYITSSNTELASVYAFGPTVAADTLAVAKSGSGEGTVTSEPAGINCGNACAAEYNAGAEVVLSAEPASGSTFAGWSGGCSGTSLCHVVLGADTEVSAEFEPLPPQPLSLPMLGTAQIATAATAAPVTSTAPSSSSAAPHHHLKRHRHRKGRGRRAKRGSR